MLDSKTWVERAVAFIGRFEGLVRPELLRAETLPPLSDGEMDEIAAEIDLPFPESLRRFLVEGAATCACHYLWELPEELQTSLSQIIGLDTVYGGAMVCDARELPEFQNPRLNPCWGPLTPEQMEFLEGLLILVPILNGDLLALNVAVDRDNPPVVYISHENFSESTTIAQSFEQFLEDWEKICYIGPEIWMLESFLNPDTGFIDATLPAAELLRESFRHALGP